ncbi:hypothetical protein GWK08_08505 [Leptobacterium flavescens]|uniref:Uncharacterized protein n=1 Tax=Leptobacterium flavescens TaxID=472055 RepID=A0A6P0UJS9_9FLAO|nr:hypothetical protein [Leptobacterium flavescens]NER13474.1 hypothetical protein [Leptobacterium flavescens]
MKTTFTVVSALLITLAVNAQIKDTVYIDLEKYDYKQSFQESYEKNPAEYVYNIQNETFSFPVSDRDRVRLLRKEELSLLHFVSIEDLLKMHYEESVRFLGEGEKKGSIKVLFKYDFPEQVYLVKKERGGLKAYPVSWIEKTE